jgi:outer membrane protein TolC
VLLQAQSDDTAAERESVDARANELQAVVALYKALGGGWESF